MRSRLLVILSLFLLFDGSCGPAPSSEATVPPSVQEGTTSPLEIRCTVDFAGSRVTGQTYFIENYAIEMTPGSENPGVIFDLSRMSWQEMDTGQIVTFSECEAWLKDSVAKTKSSLASMPDGLEKRFVQSLLEPRFEVEMSEGILTLSNEFLTYEITASQSLPATDLRRFYLYDHLNGCHKAMVLRQFPPFAQYAVSAELESRGMFPNEMRLTIKMPQGTQTSKTTCAVKEMTDLEVERVKSLLPP